MDPQFRGVRCGGRLRSAARDASRPTRLRPEFDSGDHLHPGDAGYRAMAESIDLVNCWAPPGNEAAMSRASAWHPVACWLLPVGFLARGIDIRP